MHALICEAILQRKVIHFYYDGGYRIAEPHCYGVSKNGDELLRAYQIGGHSKSGNPIGWKMFRLDELSTLSMREDTFLDPRPQYNPNDRAMASVYCRL